MSSLSLVIAFLSFALPALGCLVLFLKWQKALREKAVLEAQLMAQQESQKQVQQGLRETFASLAAQTLDQSTRSLLDTAKSFFEQQQTATLSDLEQRKISLNQMVQPLASALQAYQSQLSVMEKDQSKIFGQLDQEIKKVQEVTTALKDALKKPHVRGRWGEIQLRNCIELAGMSEFSDVVFQDASQDADGSRLVPDLTVRMPGGRYIVVDAKTPLDGFLAAIEATSEESRLAESVRHGRHLREHIKKLSTKAYGARLEGTPDFTVLFLPNEAFLYAALEVEPDLVEFAMEKKILIASPPTFIGLLKVIRYGWNEKKMAENAGRISELGRELYKRLGEFLDSYTTVGKHLDKAKDEFERGRRRLETKLIPHAQKFEELGIGEVQQ